MKHFILKMSEQIVSVFFRVFFPTEIFCQNRHTFVKHFCVAKSAFFAQKSFKQNFFPSSSSNCQGGTNRLLFFASFWDNLPPCYHYFSFWYSFTLFGSSQELLKILFEIMFPWKIGAKSVDSRDSDRLKIMWIWRCSSESSGTIKISEIKSLLTASESMYQAYWAS